MNRIEMKAKTTAKTPRKEPDARPVARMTPPPSGVKVRMYRTGLGDCFLLAFPLAEPRADGGDAFYLMIDCGVYKSTPEPRNAPRIQRIARHIRDSTGGQLDVLAITHEHWDHISAFHQSQARSIFQDEIALGTLWMAWTENMAIALAKELHQARKTARMALAHGLARMNSAAATGATPSLVAKVLDFFGPTGPGPLGAKSVQSEATMEWIRETYGKDKIRFLRPCLQGEPVTLDGVPHARIYVLGPPEDAALIRRYKPGAKGDEVYPKALEAAFYAACGAMSTSVSMGLNDDTASETRRMSLPFDRFQRIDRSRVETAVAAATALEQARRDAQKSKSGRATSKGSAASHSNAGADAAADPFFRQYYYDPKKAWRRIDFDWLEGAGELALQLDSATNNTSLALAIEVGPPGAGRVLLFPGDAQVGNWLSWFGKVEVGRGKKKQLLGKEMVWNVGGKTVTAEDLLRRTVLYKVGHHGSHNATLREKGLELMGPPRGAPELVAMLPVDEEVAQLTAGYGQMPLESLVKELLIRTNGRLLRNDAGEKPNPDVPFPTLGAVEGAPAVTTGFFDEDPEGLYFECVFGSTK